MENTAFFNTTNGFNKSELQAQEANRAFTNDNRIGVWSSDDISPASFMLSYKTANAVFNWTPSAATRLFANAQEAGVVIHSD